MLDPQIQEGCRKLVWLKDSKMAGAKEEMLRDVGMLETRKAHIDPISLGKDLQRQHRNGWY